MDIDTLEQLQAAEEGKSKALKSNVGAAIKPEINPEVQPSQDDKMADLTSRTDQLAKQMQDFLLGQAWLSTPTTSTPPLQMAALSGVTMTTAPVISGTRTSVYATATPVSTVASTMGHFQVGVSTTMNTGITSTTMTSGHPFMSHLGAQQQTTPKPATWPTQSVQLGLQASQLGGLTRMSTTPLAASSWLPDPLTSALQQLSHDVDPEASNRSAGMLFRPEYYAMHKLSNIPLCQVDYRKMSFKQLMFGMICVAQQVRTSGYNLVRLCLW